MFGHRQPARVPRAFLALSMLFLIPPYEQFTYEVALSSGYRSHFGATFASTLVSILASGAMAPPGGPAHMHLLFNDARLMQLSLVYNLVHMSSRVHASVYDLQDVSGSMRARNAFYQLLRAPDFVPGPPPAASKTEAAAKAKPSTQPHNGERVTTLGRVARPKGASNLPILFLEDDIWLVDDLPKKLHHVAKDAASKSGNRPFIIALYIPTRTGRPVATVLNATAGCNVPHTEVRLGPKPYGPGSEEGPGTAVMMLPSDDPPPAEGRKDASLVGYSAKRAHYYWGAQGLYVSDGRLRRRLADCYYQYTAQKWERGRLHFKDWALSICLEDLGVAAFTSGSSLVQHTGVSSSLFGAAETNTNFHRTCAFTFRERVPADDARDDWV
ncbi:hypothetical protein HYH03_010584 [Edaphochlamys debaryana]|uniref:Uncharacterized protein n=1 Tax=Edaphochlamys debaryana TaxID=47281 RepID=A0A836BWM8_9CHLO|nr:hypothetical protein HYH03_010584 [Edaphochlamys debaryana]|eukprot:KAG2491142.1 hypothetical protein HYH03_010584 [Edaphochlamys debaryana]